MDLHSIKSDTMSDFATFQEGTLTDYIARMTHKAEKGLAQNSDINEMVGKKLKKMKKLEILKTTKYSLSHRDIKFNNLLFEGDNLTGIVDWEGAFYAPESFDLAHVDVLAPIYGYSRWIKELIMDYSKATKNPDLIEEINIAKLLVYFRYLNRAVTHESTKGVKPRICAETNENEIEYYINRIKDWNY